MSKKFQPFIPPDKEMPEGTIRAIILGLVMTVVLGAANAYLGLKAGMTIAATYPAAVLGMAVLRMFKGSILEENMARTIGSIGESVAGCHFYDSCLFHCRNLERNGDTPSLPGIVCHYDFRWFNRNLFCNHSQKSDCCGRRIAIPRIRGSGGNS